MTASPEALKELLGRIGQGDRAAFSMLYDATAPKLYGVVIRILRRKDVAEDVLQDVYVKIWERASDFDPLKASPMTWMAVIARNRALDDVRRKTVLSIEDAPEAMNVAAATPHPLDQLQFSEDLARLMGCLETIEPDRREMILLAYYHGLTREALSQRFRKPVATIKTWLHRGLAQVRRCLGQ